MTLRPSPQQQAVIDAPLTPLRVAAGAGTGKTTTMALRLADLIVSGVVEPEAALGVTFTNKAAEELADRLRSLLPDLVSKGREIEVTTYHGFAHGLLREFGPMVGVERASGVITPGYARQLMRNALGSGVREMLDLTVPGRRVDELIALAGRLGDHLRTTDDLRSCPGAGEVAAARLEMAAVLDTYQEHKRRLGVVDYTDLISLAFRLVAAHPDVACRIRDRYSVVLLDEYQDTNPAQRELLRVVFGGGFPVAAVGDPDQTIYEWRGASLENFDAFPEHFPEKDGSPAPTLFLSRNRRSALTIVEVANRVRAQIAGAGDPRRLEALEKAAPGTVTVARLHDAPEEARWIAREVVRLHDDEGRSWRDVAVLFRRHRQMGPIRDALELAGVPVEVAALGGLLEVPEVADLYAWLRILGRPDDGPALLRVLLGARFRLGLGDLAPVAALLRARHAHSVEEAAGIGWGMLEAIDDLGHGEGLSGAAARRLEEFRGLYREMLQVAQGSSLVELARHILDRTGAWAEVEALPQSARLSARLNLYRFLDLAEQWSPLEGAPALDAFLDYLEFLTEDRAAEELDTARVSGEDAVVLITAHRAKGLEWPVVILPALADGVFGSPPQMLEDPLRFPQFLPQELRLDAGWWSPLPPDDKERAGELRHRHRNQEWRLAYVAVTRAMDHLIATCAHWYTGRTRRNPSELFGVIAGTPQAQRGPWIDDSGEPPECLSPHSLYGVEDDPLFADGWRAALREAISDPAAPRQRAANLGLSASYDAMVDQLRITLDGIPEPEPAQPKDRGFRTSVTGLITYATCPAQFHWSEVDRLPRRPSEARRRGLDLHRRIEFHNRGIVTLEEAEDSHYDFGPSDVSEGPGPGGWAAFESSRFATQRPRLVETPFELRVADARISGRIDAVYEPEEGTWEVVDFKSGRRRDDPASVTQLEAYALAIRDARVSPDSPDRLLVTFAYLGGGLEIVETEVDDDWLCAARDHVEHLVRSASAGDYRPTPSKACGRCDFIRFCESGRSWLAHHPG